ncbi:hypothetical protein, partial [uncultured Arthrobacter sp.]|uniref:hypothetical protein n=1 Tax=uncultured Arthrobacter sp. TaxID=114050 RepID=UPI0032180B8A
QYLFYELMQQPKAQSRKTGKDSVDDEALSIIATREPLLKPLVDKLKEYRTLRIFYKNFVLAALDTDNRMRCFYNVAGTETYRLSSKEDAFGFGTITRLYRQSYPLHSPVFSLSNSHPTLSPRQLHALSLDLDSSESLLLGLHFRGCLSDTPDFLLHPLPISSRTHLQIRVSNACPRDMSNVRARE